MAVPALPRVAQLATKSVTRREIEGDEQKAFSAHIASAHNSMHSKLPRVAQLSGTKPVRNVKPDSTESMHHAKKVISTSLPRVALLPTKSRSKTENHDVKEKTDTITHAAASAPTSCKLPRVALLSSTRPAKPSKDLSGSVKSVPSAKHCTFTALMHPIPFHLETEKRSRERAARRQAKGLPETTVQIKSDGPLYPSLIFTRP